MLSQGFLVFLFGIASAQGAIPPPVPTPNQTAAVQFTGLPGLIVRTGISDGMCPSSPANPGANEPRLWVPDGPARAYVDNQGQTRLIAPHLRTYAFVGSNLDNVQLRCHDMISDSAQNADPAQFNDSNWPWAFYRVDSRRMMTVYHHEFHPPSHNRPCTGGSCWYAGLTLGVANDGIHFAPLASPGHVMARPAVPFNGTDGVSRGYSDHSNIAKNPDDGYYYLIAMRKDPVLRGCVLRTNNLLDASAWRTWNGKPNDANYGYNNLPYRGEDCVSPLPQGPRENFAPGSLLYSTFLNRFIYVTFGIDGAGRNGFFLFLAKDKALTSWSAPILIAETAVPWGDNPSFPGRFTGFYPSVLDRNGGPNFDRVGETAYLYYVGGIHERRFTRVPIRFVKNQGEIRNRLEGFYRVGGGGYYSNGFNQFCGITSINHLRLMGYPYAFSDLMPYPDEGVLQDAGACGIPQGCYRIGGGGFYSNGARASCTFCPKSIQGTCGIPMSQFWNIPELGTHAGNAHQGWCSGCP